MIFSLTTGEIILFKVILEMKEKKILLYLKDSQHPSYYSWRSTVLSDFPLPNFLQRDGREEGADTQTKPGFLMQVAGGLTLFPTPVI